MYAFAFRFVSIAQAKGLGQSCDNDGQCAEVCRKNDLAGRVVRPRCATKPVKVEAVRDGKLFFFSQKKALP